MSPPEISPSPSAAAPLASYEVGAGARGGVLLHGFLGSGPNLRTLAQRWQEREPHLRLLIPDLRGHGRSPPLPETDTGATLALLAADVLAAARAADLPAPFRLVGHSLGGRVALAAARIAPASITDVVLLDIAPGPIDPTVSESRRVLEVLLAAPPAAANRRELRAFLIARGLSLALADWLLMNLATEPGRVHWAIDRQALERFHDQSMREDLWDVIAAHQVPVRCIRGARSRYVTDADLARLEAEGCRTDTLADAGHFIHVEALPALLDLLTGAD